MVKFLICHVRIITDAYSWPQQKEQIYSEGHCVEICEDNKKKEGERLTEG